jgi:hypothetical protein
MLEATHESEHLPLWVRLRTGFRDLSYSSIDSNPLVRMARTSESREYIKGTQGIVDFPFAHWYSSTKFPQHTYAFTDNHNLPQHHVVFNPIIELASRILSTGFQRPPQRSRCVLEEQNWKAHSPQPGAGSSLARSYTLWHD